MAEQNDKIPQPDLSDIADGNMYQNSGEWYAQPPARTEEENAERTALKQAHPLVQALIARLDSRIAFYKSIDSVTVDILTDLAKYQQVVEANKVIRATLQSERDYIAGLLQQQTTTP